jgi:hypothetical protein
MPKTKPTTPATLLDTLRREKQKEQKRDARIGELQEAALYWKQHTAALRQQLEQTAADLQARLTAIRALLTQPTRKAKKR